MEMLDLAPRLVPGARFNLITLILDIAIHPVHILTWYLAHVILYLNEQHLLAPNIMASTGDIWVSLTHIVAIKFDHDSCEFENPWNVSDSWQINTYPFPYFMNQQYARVRAEIVKYKWHK